MKLGGQRLTGQRPPLRGSAVGTRPIKELPVVYWHAACGTTSAAHVPLLFLFLFLGLAHLQRMHQMGAEKGKMKKERNLISFIYYAPL